MLPSSSIGRWLATEETAFCSPVHSSTSHRDEMAQRIRPERIYPYPVGQSGSFTLSRLGNDWVCCQASGVESGSTAPLVVAFPQRGNIPRHALATIRSEALSTTERYDCLLDRDHRASQPRGGTEEKTKWRRCAKSFTRTQACGRMACTPSPVRAKPSACIGTAPSRWRHAVPSLIADLSAFPSPRSTVS